MSCAEPIGATDPPSAFGGTQNPARQSQPFDKLRARNQLHALETVSETPESILRDARQAIEELAARVDTLQGHALEIVKQDEVLEPMLKFLLSVKGIAEVSAAQILGEVAILPPDMTARQWVAHAGLDPRHFSSGTSVMKKPRSVNFNAVALMLSPITVQMI